MNLAEGLLFEDHQGTHPPFCSEAGDIFCNLR